MNIIKHTGIIEKTNADTVYVKLADLSGCSTCSLKSSCDANGLSNKTFEIKVNTHNYVKGQKVEIRLSERQVFLSLFWAYIFPLLLLISGVLILSSFFNDLISGLISLFVLCIYLLILYFTRNNLNKIFTLKLNRL